MAKITWNPGTMLSPLPPALISSGDMNKPNVMTAAWTGIICSEPVITYVSIRKSRYSHELISKNKEFVINVPTWKIASSVDTVGVKSGRDLDKFALTGLTAEKCSKINAPQVKECPVSIECKVLEIREFGTHDMFLAEVVAVNVDEEYINNKGGLDLEKAGLLAYAHGFYYTLGRKIGKFGFSVEKKKTLSVKTDKFSKEKTIEKFQKAKQTPQKDRSGVEVVVKKTSFKKIKLEEQKQERKSNKPLANKSDKFAKKKGKKTNFENTNNNFRKKTNIKKK